MAAASANLQPTTGEPPDDSLDAGQNAPILIQPLSPPPLEPRPSARSQVRTSGERSRHASSPSSQATAPIPISKAKLYNNGNPDAYEMCSKPRGQVLIINNEDFSTSPNHHTSRVGSQFDAKSIKTLFEEMYFEVTHHHNLEYSEMKQSIRDFAKLAAHRTANSCFVFIMSHGSGNRGEDSFISCDGRALAISWVEDQFNNENAPNLHGKPKILVFHCCRGDEYDLGVRSAHHQLRDNEINESNGNHESDGSAVVRAHSIGERLPAVTDMLVVYSTVPGKVSIRDVDRGTWYIQILCRAIREHAHEMKLRDILDRASRQLAKYQGARGMMQSSEYTVRTFRDFYFNPYIWHDFMSPLQPNGVETSHMELPDLEALDLGDA